MLDINKHISDLEKNKKFNSACRTFGGELSDDLKQEVILMLLEDTPKLTSAIEGNYLPQYALIMARNCTRRPKYIRENFMTNLDIDNFLNILNIDDKEEDREKKYDESKINISSDFDYVKFEDEHEYIRQQELILKNKKDEFLIDFIKDESLNQSSQYFYHANVMLSVINHKSIREFAKSVGIPYGSILYTIKEYKNYLNEKLKEYENLLLTATKDGHYLP